MKESERRTVTVVVARVVRGSDERARLYCSPVSPSRVCLCSRLSLLTLRVMEMRATCPSLLDLPVESPQGWIPRTSGLPQWPQALDSYVSQNPQGGGGRSATQSRRLYASEARTQSEPKRAVEEFFLLGDRVRALNERVRRETIYGGPVTGSVTEEDTRMPSAPPSYRDTRNATGKAVLYTVGRTSGPTRAPRDSDTCSTRRSSHRPTRSAAQIESNANHAMLSHLSERTHRELKRRRRLGLASLSIR